MELEAHTGAVFYWDQALRPIRDNMAGWVRDATNFVRRTVRLAVGQPPPQQRLPNGFLIFGASLEGEVPFKRSGALSEGVGIRFDKRPGEAVGAVSVNSHGWEIGQAKNQPGVKRPHLAPTVDANREMIIAILEGRTPAPQYGDISFVTHRRPLHVQLHRSRRGRLSQRVTFGGQMAAGTYKRFKRPRFFQPRRRKR